MSIYKGLNVRDEIEDNIFRETVLLFMDAASKGISQSSWPDVPDEFLSQLRTNTEIWAAFRTHRMQNDIASQLIDENGQLKKFDRWVEDIKGMTNHYVGPWLRTEYNTAVIRAHQAADWKHFEAEADVFQNVRWMPTTSPDQDPLHRQYWEKKLTLPINHPFWEKHRPGDRWNCKCTLQQTDEPVNDEVIRDFYPVPQQAGLDNNPAKDGKIFSDSHPYVANAHPGARQAVEKAIRSKRVRTDEEKRRIQLAWEERKEIYKKAREWVKDVPVKLIQEDAYEAAVKILRIDPSYDLPRLVVTDLGGMKHGRLTGGSYNEELRILRVNSNKDYQKIIQDKRKGVYVKAGYHTQTNTILHELGHAIHADLNLTNYKYASGKSLRRLSPDYVKKTLSGYGATGQEEFEAELISGIISGKKYPDNILSESVISTSDNPLARKILAKGRDVSDAGIRARKVANNEAAKDLESWYKQNLPTKEINGMPMKRFVVETQYGDNIVINKNFYNELISKYKDDVAYIDKLEISKNAHRYLKNAKYTRTEEPEHEKHAGSKFKVYEKEIEGIKYELKTKVESDGEYLYYMKRK